MTRPAFYNLPYPSPKSRKEILFSAGLIALTVYFLLAVFQPFGTYNFYSSYKYLLLVPYSVIAFLSFAAADFLFRKKAGGWQLGHELLKISVVLGVCALPNYLYNILFINNTSFALKGLVAMGLFTFALGAPAVAIYALAKYVFLKTTTPVPEIFGETILLEETTTAQPHLQILPLSGEAICFPESDFLFAESAGNYCYVFFLKQGSVKKEIFRLPLKALEAQIGTDNIVRCHRSFMVNIKNAIRAKGNAQGGQLHFQNVEMPVPVSRKYASVLQKTRDQQQPS